MLTPESLRKRSATELAAVMASGHHFDPDAVAGWIYRGTSLGLPRLVERLSWIKFAKAFHREPSGVRGWNMRVEQDGLDRPWRPTLRNNRPVTFGGFEVIDDRGCITLDYGAERGPLRVVRDPIVALDASADVLFGRSLIALAGRTFATPSYFLLERDGKLTDVRPRA